MYTRRTNSYSRRTNSWFAHGIRPMQVRWARAAEQRCRGWRATCSPPTQGTAQGTARLSQVSGSTACAATVQPALPQKRGREGPHLVRDPHRLLLCDPHSFSSASSQFPRAQEWKLTARPDSPCDRTARPRHIATAWCEPEGPFVSCHGAARSSHLPAPGPLSHRGSQGQARSQASLPVDHASALRGPELPTATPAGHGVWDPIRVLSSNLLPSNC